MAVGNGPKNPFQSSDTGFSIQQAPTPPANMGTGANGSQLFGPLTPGFNVMPVGMQQATRAQKMGVTFTGRVQESNFHFNARRNPYGPVIPGRAGSKKKPFSY